MLEKILVVGGDERALRLASLLLDAGYQVRTLGLHMDDEKSADIPSVNLLLFPYPFAVKNDCIPTYTGLTLHPRDVLASAKDSAVILAGHGLDAYVQSMNELGKHLVLCHYMGSEAFLQMNADISAEASVYEAMHQTEQTLYSMTVLVIGYGLFARAIALRLKALGAKVWVAARRAEQRKEALGDGMQTVAIANMTEIAPLIRIVFNTVPAHVMDYSFLSALKRNACLLELASAPYGFERTEAESLQLHYEILPSLPARYAPETAAQALLNVVTERIAEESK